MRQLRSSTTSAREKTVESTPPAKKKRVAATGGRTKKEEPAPARPSQKKAQEPKATAAKSAGTKKTRGRITAAAAKPESPNKESEKEPVPETTATPTKAGGKEPAPASKATTPKTTPKKQTRASIKEEESKEPTTAAQGSQDDDGPAKEEEQKEQPKKAQPTKKKNAKKGAKGPSKKIETTDKEEEPHEEAVPSKSDAAIDEHHESLEKTETIPVTQTPPAKEVIEENQGPSKEIEPSSAEPAAEMPVDEKDSGANKENKLADNTTSSAVKVEGEAPEIASKPSSNNVTAPGLEDEAEEDSANEKSSPAAVKSKKRVIYDKESVEKAAQAVVDGKMGPTAAAKEFGVSVGAITRRARMLRNPSEAASSSKGVKRRKTIDEDPDVQVIRVEDLD